MIKTVSILGSTGTIGKSLLNIIASDKKNFQIVLLTADKNHKLLIKQAKKFKVKNLIITNRKSYEILKDKLKKNKSINIFNNYNCFNKIFKKKIYYVMSSISGINGLPPTLKIIKYTQNIAIANKESIIVAWNLISKELKKNSTNFVPVDSEHFSIWYGLNNYRSSSIDKIYLTASGGPFLNYDYKKLKNIEPKDALKHPKWKMGKKISIDSSTLMNKIFELIEAQKLFNIPKEKIDIIIHPNSLVHAIIELKNGLIKFIYHETSMKVPLANAIFAGKLNIDDFYKKNKKTDILLENLSFEKVKKKNFPIIKIKNRITEYPSTPIIINAVNELLVNLFLTKKLPYLSITKTILYILNDYNYRKYAIKKPKNIKEIVKIDTWAREVIKRKFNLND